MSNNNEELLKSFIRNNLSPTKKEHEYIKTKYEELQGFLSGRTFQNGSYARQTSTTPVNDLDVFYVLSEETYELFLNEILTNKTYNIDYIIESIVADLKEKYPTDVNIKAQPHSIGIYFGSEESFSIDVVPSIPAEDGIFWVPESARMNITKRRAFYETSNDLTLNWIKTDPKGYIKEASELNKLSNGNFRKCVKFVKKWKIGCKFNSKNFLLKSFHTEQIICTLLKDNIYSDCITTISKFFRSLPQYIENPRIPDKADSSRFIDEYVNDLSEYEKSIILDQGTKALEIINEINMQNNESDILTLIKKLLFMENSMSKISAGLATAHLITSTRRRPAYSKPYRK